MSLNKSDIFSPLFSSFDQVLPYFVIKFNDKRQKFVPVKGCPSFTPFTSIIVDSFTDTQKQNRHLNEKFVLVIFIIINNNQGKKRVLTT